jgi:ATPase subunit of ABC transporter with duplicated ATPase domains
MWMLQAYEDTLIVASHDMEILRFVDTLWHIEEGKIPVFSGNYEDYRRETQNKRTFLENDLLQLTQKKKEAHN